MATTDSHAALQAVLAIEESGVRFAVLHDEAALAHGRVASDVDLVADRTIHELVRASAEQWASLGLFPVVVWPYDVGGTGSVFLATSDAGQGVQIDVLHDVEGRGRYGALSDRLLQSAETGTRFATVAPAQRVAYLLAKRLSKGEVDRARLLTEEASSTGIDRDVLRPDIASRVGSFLEDGSAPDPWSRNRSWSHSLSRLRRPVGGWVEILGEDAKTVASTLVTRFGRFLPHTRSIPAPHLGTWATSVAPIRWRAGLVASHGEKVGITPGPDISIDGSVPIEEAAIRTVRSLALRNTGGRRVG